MDFSCCNPYVQTSAASRLSETYLHCTATITQRNLLRNIKDNQSILHVVSINNDVHILVGTVFFTVKTMIVMKDRLINLIQSVFMIIIVY